MTSFGLVAPSQAGPNGSQRHGPPTPCPHARDLLCIVAEGRSLRWRQVIQVTVQHVKTKEAHLGQGHHARVVGYAVGHDWSTIAGWNARRVVKFLFFRTTAPSSHRISNSRTADWARWLRNANKDESTRPSHSHSLCRSRLTSENPLVTVLVEGGGGRGRAAASADRRFKFKLCGDNFYLIN